DHHHPGPGPRARVLPVPGHPEVGPLRVVADERPDVVDGFADELLLDLARIVDLNAFGIDPRQLLAIHSETRGRPEVVIERRQARPGFWGNQLQENELFSAA